MIYSMKIKSSSTTSLRLTQEAETASNALASKLGISATGVLELAIRKLYIMETNVQVLSNVGILPTHSGAQSKKSSIRLTPDAVTKLRKLVEILGVSQAVVLQTSLLLYQEIDAKIDASLAKGSLTFDHFGDD